MIVIKCPCVNCVCVAICRHKIYSKLVYQCELLENYIDEYRGISAPSNCYWRVDIFKALRPTAWTTNMKTGLFVLQA